MLALLVGCSGSSGGTDGGGNIDAGGNTDAGHACRSLDAGCATQADCGETSDSLHVYTCGATGRCERQASFNASCFADVAQIQIQVTTGPGFNQGAIKSFEIRTFYPNRVDGSPLACNDVQVSPDFPDGGSPLDVDGTLNVEEIFNSTATSCGGGTCTYLTNTSAVPGSTPVVLVQAYSGPHDSSGQHATGIQLGVGCSTATITEQATPLQTIDVTVNPD
ncbi:MAG: hypothetical protein JST54_14615 [Deltaproteobacteria bacterium]|nr:hypothetical protein [Deltaproteobacteria bacterium]